MKRVTCDSCGHRYDYAMTRTVIGSYSGFALTRQKADDEAAGDAEQKLKMMLETECDVVPCPECGALTRQMKAAKAALVPMSLGGLALGSLIVGGVFLFGQWSGRWFVVLGLVGIGLIVWSGLALLAGFWEFIAVSERIDRRMKFR